MDEEKRDIGFGFMFDDLLQTLFKGLNTDNQTSFTMVNRGTYSSVKKAAEVKTVTVLVKDKQWAVLMKKLMDDADCCITPANMVQILNTKHKRLITLSAKHYMYDENKKADKVYAKHIIGLFVYGYVKSNPELIKPIRKMIHAHPVQKYTPAKLSINGGWDLVDTDICRYGEPDASVEFLKGGRDHGTFEICSLLCENFSAKRLYKVVVKAGNNVSVLEDAIIKFVVKMKRYYGDDIFFDFVKNCRCSAIYQFGVAGSKWKSEWYVRTCDMDNGEMRELEQFMRRVNEYIQKVEAIARFALKN